MYVLYSVQYLLCSYIKVTKLHTWPPVCVVPLHNLCLADQHQFAAQQMQRQATSRKSMCIVRLWLVTIKIHMDFLLVIIELFSLDAFVSSQFMRLADWRTDGFTITNTAVHTMQRGKTSDSVRHWWLAVFILLNEWWSSATTIDRCCYAVQHWTTFKDRRIYCKH